MRPRERANPGPFEDVVDRLTGCEQPAANSFRDAVGAIPLSRSPGQGCSG
jgi:hypothetical protein